MDRLTQLIHKAASVEGITREERSEYHRRLMQDEQAVFHSALRRSAKMVETGKAYLDTIAADRFHSALLGT